MSLIVLTDKPWIPLVVLDGEVEEVVLEALDEVRLGLHGQGTLDLGLVSVAHEAPGAPAVAADPRKCPGRVAPPHRLHQPRYLLVRTVDYAS